MALNTKADSELFLEKHFLQLLLSRGARGESIYWLLLVLVLETWLRK